MGLAVVDASVAAKWFLEEEDSEAALRLRSDFFEGTLALREPSVLPWEIMNALRYSRRFAGREFREVAKDLDRSGFVTVPLFGEYLERTVELALETDISIYGSSYLALAAIEECPLYTADVELIEAAPHDTHVIHIRDYTSPIGP